MKPENKNLLVQVFCTLALCVVPFWLGREFAVPYTLRFMLGPDNGANIMSVFNFPEVVFKMISCSLFTLVIIFFLGYLVPNRVKHSKGLAISFFAILVLLMGFGFFRNGFDNRNQIVFSDQAYKVDSLDYGIVYGFVGFVVFVAVYILAVFMKNSKLNLWVRTRPAMLVFAIVELVTFLILQLTPLGAFLY